MAGIKVVASYEKWPEANITNLKNNGHKAPPVDIRTLALRELPSDIDVVVGSPPCIEFSFSNRGGGGDIEDGLRDIKKFLTIVDYLKPKAWAMENVPRVGEILDRELKSKGRLARFRHLNFDHEILNAEEFGLPQRRLRCIAGNLDFKLLKAYATRTKRLTLGLVIDALAKPTIADPIYDIQLSRSALSDHDLEDNLDIEEERINRAAKLLHPVYNKMAFPDPLDRAVRTVTATCTRVSRESIIVEDPTSPDRYRRLTLRERSTLQGFPITFNFYGANYGHKLRMIGNAMPPLLSLYIGQAIRGIPATKAVSPETAISVFSPSTEIPPVTLPSKATGVRFPEGRTFRFAIGSLHFKSGVRFELRNKFKSGAALWQVAFVFGSPKSIHEMVLKAELCTTVVQTLPIEVRASIEQSLSKCRTWIRRADVQRMQDVWSHRGPGLTRPFMVLDRLDECADELKGILASCAYAYEPALEKVIVAAFGRRAKSLVGLGKLRKHAQAVLAGVLVGATANVELESHGRARPAEKDRASRSLAGAER